MNIINFIKTKLDKYEQIKDEKNNSKTHQTYDENDALFDPNMFSIIKKFNHFTYPHECFLLACENNHQNMVKFYKQNHLKNLYPGYQSQIQQNDIFFDLNRVKGMNHGFVEACRLGVF